MLRQVVVNASSLMSERPSMSSDQPVTVPVAWATSVTDDITHGLSKDELMGIIRSASGSTS